MTPGHWRPARGPDRFPFKIAASRSLHGEPGIECPKCRRGELRAYYHAFDREERIGTMWVWCPACRSTGQLTRQTPFPTMDLGPDPFADLSPDEFRALEADRSEPFMDRLNRLWEAGVLGMGRMPEKPKRPPRWRMAGGEHQFPFMGAASRSLAGERVIPCPKCKETELRAYFHVFNEEEQKGTIWVWCPACRVYEHLPRVKPKVDLGPDPFAGPDFHMTMEELLDRLQRLWNAGKLGPGAQR